MFDIGFQELIIIFIVALLVFGPEKLPEVGRTLGKWMIEIRRGVQSAKTQMETEFSESEKTQSEIKSAPQNTEKAAPEVSEDSHKKEEV